ncbi:hypothetical protein SAMN05661080_03067 [Modestobacter sp. DSM 44400]|uniref:hypothetical protein n=1 Tax=Modestobacter sp. DSM 44400 TaxID=1550230 RepID=UPI000894F971|nr:hypothetical protein [Modestobacter sp. DSM 44400]SDY32189.1 hypothetical protein SAMN05661080_03067 [Modestobacter sp. DSM 44400]
MWGRAALRGAAAGLAGVAVMTAGEKLEQRITHRPNSYVPARTLTALATGRRLSESARPPVRNHVMHWGTGAAVGALRGVWSAAGLRGWRASAWHSVVRLATDQTLENATGVGSPPWTWSRQDQVVDLLHKVVYSFATGLVADRLIPPLRGPRIVRDDGPSRVTRGVSGTRGAGGLWD